MVALVTALASRGKEQAVMPSIPQSLLWISLVVLWLFVLVPMLINKRDAVRRTSDVALATRVLNSGAAARLLKRGGPADGHRSDPDWQPEEDEDEDIEEVVAEAVPHRTRTVAVVTSLAEEGEPDYLDVDVVDEDSGALPVGASLEREETEEVAEREIVAQAEPEPELEFETDEVDADDDAVEDAAEEIDEELDGAAEFEYVEDTSGLEAEEDPATTAAPAAPRRRLYDSKTAAAVSMRKYKFRKRVLLTMAVLLVASAATAFLVAPVAWWVCGSLGGVTLLYLAYLRRQTRIEERLRRRRMQRMARSRLGVENTDDGELDVVPSRLRRPGAVVLEIDDEDPIFEQLDYAPFARHFDLPRAAGQ